MPKIGVAGPWLADYASINGVVSYSNGFKAARMTSFEATPDESGQSNEFRSDNEVSEIDTGGSKSGTITESIDDFSQEAAKKILGVKEKKITIAGKEVAYLAYDNSVSPGYFGHGIVITKRKNKKDRWRAVVHRKIAYDVPSDAANTRANPIEWQAEELKAKYMPDDSPSGEWKDDATFDTEAEAIAFVEAILNIQGIGALTVNSELGAEVGKTKITVAPSLMENNSYKYIIAAAVGLPSYDQLIGDDYSDWDGSAEIIALSNMQILVVEVDANNLAKKAGIATITSNDG